MFEFLRKTALIILTGASIAMAPAMADETTPSHVYQVVDNIKAELAEMHKINLSEPPQVKVNLTKRQPRHVLQKAREIHNDVQRLRLINGLDENLLPTLPVRAVEPSDVRTLAGKILADVRELREKMGAPAPAVASLPINKVPTDVYGNLVQVKVSLTQLGVPVIMPNDVYQVALTIVSEIEKVRAVKGVTDPVPEPSVAKGKSPKDVYNLVYELLGKIKKLSGKDGYHIPGGVVMPKKVMGRITPTEVMDMMNNVLAEVGAVKVAVGSTAVTELVGRQLNKTPSDVYHAMVKATALVDTLL